MTDAFDWADPLRLGAMLDNDERQVQEMAHRFAQDVLQPRIVAAFREERIDREFYRELGQLGLLAPTLPAEFGGGGASYVTYGLVAREIERVDSGYRSMFSVQGSLAGYAIHAYGSEEQRQRYLPDICTGERVACFGLTEPDAGSDPARMLARAEACPGGYRLNGVKTWISAAPIADIAVVWVRSGAHDNRVRGFILERGMAGFSTPTIEGKLSLRASVTGQLVLDDVVVGEEQLLPSAIGLEAPFGCLNRARYGIAWGTMGAAEACWHAARQYGLERQQFGRPLAATQLFQTKLADMQTEIALGLQGALAVGRAFDRGAATGEMISLIKRNNCAKALTVARMARDMHGSNGIAEEFHVMRHLVNLETVNTYEGTYDIHGLILGRAQTGISAFA